MKCSYCDGEAIVDVRGHNPRRHKTGCELHAGKAYDAVSQICVVITTRCLQVISASEFLQSMNDVDKRMNGSAQ